MNTPKKSLEELVNDWKKESSLENAKLIKKFIAGTEWEDQPTFMWPVDLPSQQGKKLEGQMKTEQLISV